MIYYLIKTIWFDGECYERKIKCNTMDDLIANIKTLVAGTYKIMIFDKQ